MCMGNLHKHENSKDSEATLGIYDILDKGAKVGMSGGCVLDFRNKNKQFAGS